MGIKDKSKTAAAIKRYFNLLVESGRLLFVLKRVAKR